MKLCAQRTLCGSCAGEAAVILFRVFLSFSWGIASLPQFFPTKLCYKRGWGGLVTSLGQSCVLAWMGLLAQLLIPEWALVTAALPWVSVGGAASGLSWSLLTVRSSGGSPGLMRCFRTISSLSSLLLGGFGVPHCLKCVFLMGSVGSLLLFWGGRRSWCQLHCEGSLTQTTVLQIVKESQQQHGLRHGDFQRYRWVLGAAPGAWLHFS